MSQTERRGDRDLTYSQWHRTASMRRFLPFRDAHALAYVDVDCCEYCARCRAPLALIETARDVGQDHKTATVLMRLAELAHIPGYVVLYRVVETDIDQFRVRQVWPVYDELWTVLEPAVYAEVVLQGLRARHQCPLSKNEAA